MDSISTLFHRAERCNNYNEISEASHSRIIARHTCAFSPQYDLASKRASKTKDRQSKSSWESCEIDSDNGIAKWQRLRQSRVAVQRIATVNVKFGKEAHLALCPLDWQYSR